MIRDNKGRLVKYLTDEERKEHGMKDYQTYHKWYLEYKKKRYGEIMNNPVKKAEFLKHWNERRKLRRIKRRQEMLDILGHKCNNPSCPIPKEIIKDIDLQIDHVKNGGAYKRFLEMKKDTDGFYRKILKEIKAGSKDYQILCSFCNWRKRFEGER